MSEAKPKRSDGLETMERLLNFAEAELDAVGSLKFNLGRVLEKAEIAKSSAYHHFGSRDGIIAAVEARSITAQIEQSNLLMRTFVESAPDIQTATEYLRILVNYSADITGVQARQRRVVTLAAAQSSETLAAIIGQSQRDGAEYLTETFQIIADRGWIMPKTSLLGIAHFLLASVFGRVLIDFTADEQIGSVWADAMYESLIALLNPVN